MSTTESIDKLRGGAALPLRSLALAVPHVRVTRRSL